MLYFSNLFSTENPQTNCIMVSKKYEVSQLFLSLKIMKINAFWAANQYIKMISEGSCDAEDWNNDAENSALHHRNKLYFKMY